MDRISRLPLLILICLGLLVPIRPALAGSGERTSLHEVSGKPKKSSRKKRDRKKKDRKKKTSKKKPIKPTCTRKEIKLAPGPVGPLLQAATYLPAPSDFPRGTDQITMSALVRLAKKTAVLFDPIELKKKDKHWILDRIQAAAHNGPARLKQLHRAGVRPHACPDSPDSFLKRIYRPIRKGTWEKVLLHSTWRWNPGAHSLVDDIAADMKQCGKKHYLRQLRKLPRFGDIPPETWFVLIRFQVTGDKKGTQVEIGVVPVDGGWRIAHLRMICN